MTAPRRHLPPVLVSPLFLVLLAACSSAPGTARQTPLSQQIAAQSANRVLRVAHRGDSFTHPENTLPAFDSAAAVGSDMIELDFHETQDRVLVCFHDKTLDRTTNSTRLWKQKGLHLRDQTLTQLEKLDAGAWKGARFAGTRIPTLEAALRSIHPRSIAMVEHKAGRAEELVAVVRKLDLVDKLIVQSFEWGWLERVHKLEPRLTIAALGGYDEDSKLDDDVLRQIARTGASMIHWHAPKLNARLVRRLRKLGYLVCAYTVNEEAEWKRLVTLGLDAITTDVVWKWSKSRPTSQPAQ